MKDSAKIRNVQRDLEDRRQRELTEDRKTNNFLGEKIKRMKLEMEYPSILKRYEKWSLKLHFKSYILKKAPPGLRWVHWIEYALFRKSTRRKIRELASKDDQKTILNR